MELDFSTPTHPNAKVLVDAEDADWVASRRWTPADNGSGEVYFVSMKGRKKITLHREVARARFYEHVDHKDGNTFDNRKTNLRTCTRQQNTWNQTAHAKGNCGFKGVHKVKDRYKTYISKDGTTYTLGTYDDAETAALAHDAAALWLHGEFAYLNFPDAGTLPKKPRPPVKYRPRNATR